MKRLSTCKTVGIARMASARLAAFMLLTCLCLQSTQAAPLMAQRFAIDVPEQALADALNALSEQLDVPVLYRFELVSDKRGRRVVGRYRIDEAVALLLQGTGLSGGLSDTGVVTISEKLSVTASNNRKDEVTMKKTLLAKIIGFIVGASALPHTQAADTAPQLEEVLVTGSHIRRKSQADLPSPTFAITSQDIANQGASTIADITKNLSINSGADFQVDSMGSNTTIGTANINLRNLGLGSTLVLINGRRQTVSTAASPDGASFVDTNALMPAIMIDRMEVLKDGAASTYGSDAVAGVVNFITRDRFEGFDVDLNYQSVTEGSHSDARLGAIWGMQSADERSRVVIAGSYFDRSPLGTIERDFTRGTAISFTGQPATYLFADGSGRAVDPACGTAPGTAVQFGFCTFDFSDFFDLSPEEERLQLFATASHVFNDSTRGGLEVGYTRSEVTENSSPSYPFLYFNPLISLASGNPAAVLFGQDVLFKGRVYGSGSPPFVTTMDQDTYRIAADLETQFDGGWLWSNSLAYSRNQADYDRPDTLRDRIQDGFDGVGGPNGDQQYNPLFGADNDPALLDFLIGNTNLDADASMLAFDSIVSGDLFELEAGTVAAAFGVHFRQEDLDHDWGEAYNANQLISLFGGPDYSGDRDIYALFAEFSVPVTPTLELQLAGRYEDYGSGVSSFDPKLAMLWRPGQALSVRASAGTAFRAPSLFQEIARQTSTPFVNDPATGQSNIFVVAQALGNEALEPEEADVYNLGFTLSPLDGLEFSLDYWRFEYEDVITKENAQAVINANNPDQVIRDAITGSISELRLNFINAAQVDTDGLDMELRFEQGAFNISGNFSYVNSYDLQQTVGAPTISGVGSRNATNVARALPRVRGNLMFGWEQDVHSAYATVRYIHEYDDDANDNAKIDAHTTLDLRYSLNLSDLLGGSSTTVSLGAINITDEEPPVVDTLLGYDTKTHDPRGRMWYLNLNYAL